MGNKNTALASGESKDNGIIPPAQPRIVSTLKINGWFVEANGTHDPAIEIRISLKFDFHPYAAEVYSRASSNLRLSKGYDSRIFRCNSGNRSSTSRR